MFAGGGIFSTVGGFDVSAAVAGSGAGSMSSVGASSITTMGTSGISEPSRSPPPMATSSPASVPPFPSLSPAHPRPEVSMSPDTVAPQMVLPHADLPATTRSSPGRPIFAVGGCDVVVVAAGGIVSTVGGFDVSAVGAGSGAGSRCTVGTGGISAAGVVPPMDTPVPSLAPAIPRVGSPPLLLPPSQPSALPPTTQLQPAFPHPPLRRPQPQRVRGTPRPGRVRPDLPRLPMPAAPLPLRGAWVAGPPSTSPPITAQQPASSPLPDLPLRGPLRPRGRGVPRPASVRPDLPRLPMLAAPLPLRGAWVAGPPVFPSSPIAQANDPVAQAEDNHGWQGVVRGGRPPNEEETSRMMWEEELRLQLNVINRERISKEFFGKHKKTR